jgi:hypothetical protein
MALVKTKPADTTTPAGSFESPETEGTATVIDNAAPAANEPAADTAATSTQSAPAQATTKAVTVSKRAEASAFAKEVEEMKGAADFAYGNYAVFKGNNGALVQTGDGGGNLGRWAKVSMIAWDDHFEISPGSKSEKSKDAVGYSKDGETVDSIIGSQYGNWVGKPVAEYVHFLQTDADYPDAKMGRFIDVACVVHEADSEDAFNGEIIQVTLSQSSIPSFSQYQEKLVMKAKAIARGIPGVVVPEDPFTFYFLRELASKNGNNWTKLKVLDKLPAKL